MIPSGAGLAHHSPDIIVAAGKLRSHIAAMANLHKQFPVWGPVILLFLLAGGACADGLQAGEWKAVQTPEFNGAAAPAQEAVSCLTEEAVADLDKTFSPVGHTTNSVCERTEHELTPQRLKWRLECKGQIDMDVAGEFIFVTPQHYTATITARSSMLGQLMQSVRTSIDAERIGECP